MGQFIFSCQIIELEFFGEIVLVAAIMGAISLLLSAIDNALLNAFGNSSEDK